jgi:hypothetical protein
MKPKVMALLASMRRAGELKISAFYVLLAAAVVAVIFLAADHRPAVHKHVAHKHVAHKHVAHKHVTHADDNIADYLNFLELKRLYAS